MYVKRFLLTVFLKVLLNNIFFRSMTIATIARYEPPQELLFAETYQGAPLLTKMQGSILIILGELLMIFINSPHNVFERLSHIQNTRVPNQNKEKKIRRKTRLHHSLISKHSRASR